MDDAGDEGEKARGPIEVKVFGRTDVGLVREHNEDNFLVADLGTGNRSLLPEVRDHQVGERGTLLAVCDGMGGAAAGEVASQIAVDTVYELMRAEGAPKSVKVLASRLEAAVLDAGRRIFESARADRSRRGMGTTITAATLISGRIIFAQVGDSRAYLIRNGKIVQVTRDQSLVNQLIEAGQLKPEEAELFEHSNIILQALGTAEDVTVDLTYADLRRGDVVVMCSDGLSGLVSDDTIRDIVLKGPEPIDACKSLTEAAREAGGHDNITVIVAKFEGEGLEPADESAAVTFQRLELTGKTGFQTRQPPKSKAAASSESSGDDDEAEADSGPRDSDESVLTPAERPAERTPSGGAFGSNPWLLAIAVVVVLAVGVGLGYLIVSSMAEPEDEAPPPSVSSAIDSAATPAEAPIDCHFTADAPGTRLVIDGQDYGEIPPDGRWVRLEPGLHSVEGRHDPEVVVQQPLTLVPDQSRVEVPLLIASALPAAMDAGRDEGGPLVSAEAGIELGGDGGQKPPDAGPAPAPTSPPRVHADGGAPLTKLPAGQRRPPRPVKTGAEGFNPY